MALEYIARYVRYGFYRPDEIEQIVGEDLFSNKIPRKRFRELVKAEGARQREEQKSWPAVTDCDRLDRAFATLEASGILALHNAGYTPSECIAEMSEQYYAAGGAQSAIVGYCFYHRQDMDHALEYHKLGLAFGDINGGDGPAVKIGNRVRSALEADGLRVAWTGSSERKIDVIDFRWLRRRKTA